MAFTVRSLDESIAWYQQKLGFLLLHRYISDEMQFALLGSGETKLELFYFGSKTEKLPDYRKELISDLHVIGTKHVCFEVSNLKSTLKSLKTKGVQIVTQPDKTAFGGLYAFIKDCNGILIELYQHGK